MEPILVAVSGFSSEVGKTGLMCDLLRFLPTWEAIKVTRGHYRSCGKDPHACCVSHLLGDNPLVFSGRDQTYKEGKDTGRYWDAGASNVHWVVGADGQIIDGVRTALSRVKSQGVFVEGTSFLKHISVNYSVMVARPGLKDIKSTAASALANIDALFVNAERHGSKAAEEILNQIAKRGMRWPDIPIYFAEDKPLILEQIDRLSQCVCKQDFGT
ncbi:MAG TPA: hypothetical protein VEZ90_07030 [Blastocatellia bacterium]|nr:hypothetical protein [Blastocatellia bacterium]